MKTGTLARLLTRKRLASWTTLTYLELSETPEWSNAEALQNLQKLEKLVIFDCWGLEFDLFSPGVFASLVVLYIGSRETSDRSNPSRRGECYYQPDSECEEPDLSESEIQELSKVGSTILALPSLKELSGCSPIFDVLIMHERLEGWLCWQELIVPCLGKVRYWRKLQ